MPKVPQASLNKRKWSEPTKAILQSIHIQDGIDDDDRLVGPSQLASSKSFKAARISSGDEHGEEIVDDEFAPGNDADYFVDEDDDGGRFFGGGLTIQQKRILEIMNASTGIEDQTERDSAPKAEEQLKSFRKTLVRLERAINKNQEMRTKFANDPSK